VELKRFGREGDIFVHPRKVYSDSWRSRKTPLPSVVTRILPSA
jgi:hypothetical protein